MADSIKLCSECNNCSDVYGTRWCFVLGILCEDRKFNCRTFKFKKTPVVVSPRPSVKVSSVSPVNFLMSYKR